ncbi:MAG: RNA 2',3'-cyclic phosphodiesterase, partial [Desulfuromonadales bacterium]|nr:RNA 2',3'-cyclic phosphodiesterase [Desulfuromonadales bacterium]
MSSVRAFLAIPLPWQLQESIRVIQTELQASIAAARWTRPENLHLTLHFFAKIEQETLEKLKVSVLSVMGCQRSFQVEVNGLGAFPNLHRPRVIWLGLEPRGQLEQLHRATERCLRQAGLTTDSRPYSPHLTIGRLRGGKLDLTKRFISMQEKTIEPLNVDRLILYESRLRPEGAQHIPLLTVNFDDKNT